MNRCSSESIQPLSLSITLTGPLFSDEGHPPAPEGLAELLQTGRLDVARPDAVLGAQVPGDGVCGVDDRRASPELDVFYSDDPADLGNLSDYDEFLRRLVDIYAALKPFVKQGAYLTIIVKNVKKGGVIYPLAWDLGRLLGQFYTLKDERIWCQDNQRLAPYGLGSAWVSNTFHHYCLQFRNDLEISDKG